MEGGGISTIRGARLQNAQARLKYAGEATQILVTTGKLDPEREESLGFDVARSGTAGLRTSFPDPPGHAPRPRLLQGARSPELSFRRSGSCRSGEEKRASRFRRPYTIGVAV